MKRETSVAAALLFCSGLSALIYQTVWFREFRLIFGASTFATAGVLAIFMGGLGAGSAILGRRADTSPAPLAFYGRLEIIIAASAALSPLLLFVVRRLYIALGGAAAMGLTLATVVRILLAALVLAVPTFVMGGTLPAAARAIETRGDSGRRKVALLYGCNTLGAVTGTLLSTFYLLENLGNRQTLFAAVALNLVIGGAAIAIGRRPVWNVPRQEEGEPVAAALMPPRAVLISSAVVGFAFLLMELVWYRMLTPILGGTTFTFGLILAVALLGIGLGGMAYSFWSGGAPNAGVFAVTCTLEALAVIVPYAVGDRIAIFANTLRPLAILGFGGDIIAWTIITFFVVFPAAFVSGVQFPILIALLGRGREDVGRHVGLAYAWNTGGAIAGSLAGGFGLIPMLSATGCWAAVAALLALLGLVAAVFALRRKEWVPAIVAAVTAVLSFAALGADGPTALWRHTGIGAGRAPELSTRNQVRGWVRDSRREVRWEADGRESSIAILDADDRVFIMNGKADGSARGDAGTQVMAGMLGAVIHPQPGRSLVIGLGTGSTAGWLAAVPTMQRVDVVELEPLVLRVARDNAAVNHDVLANPKVRIRIDDAREVLLTAREPYDIIFSEPSNPYRAGIASLFTAEFYEAAASRLRRNGIFLQWVQAYDIDNATLRTIYGTLHSVFPHIDTWHTTEADLLLVASKEPIVYDIDEIRRRLQQPVYGSAMHLAWRMESAEGLFSNFMASDRMPVALAERSPLNTDDRTLIEFGFARSLGEKARVDLNQLAAFATGIGAARPTHQRGALNWRDVDLNRWHDTAFEIPIFNADPMARARAEFTKLYEDGELQKALIAWRERTWYPLNSQEESRLAEVLADAGVEDAVGYAEKLRPLQPTEADALVARTRLRQRAYPESAAAVERAFIRYRTDAWPSVEVMGRALDTAVTLARIDHAFAPALLDALSKPFAAGQWSDARKIYRIQIAHAAYDCGPKTVAALRDMEPEFPWTYDLLNIRQRCYASAHLGRLAERAHHEWQEYLAAEPQPFGR